MESSKVSIEQGLGLGRERRRFPRNPVNSALGKRSSGQPNLGIEVCGERDAVSAGGVLVSIASRFAAGSPKSAF